jgi:hypothetical protein
VLTQHELTATSPISVPRSALPNLGSDISRRPLMRGHKHRLAVVRVDQLVVADCDLGCGEPQHSRGLVAGLHIPFRAVLKDDPIPVVTHALNPVAVVAPARPTTVNGKTAVSQWGGADCSRSFVLGSATVREHAFFRR